MKNGWKREQQDALNAEMIRLYTEEKLAGSMALWMSHSRRKDRQTQIEGLHHGGHSGRSRRQNTDFGSGWQGLGADTPEGRERRRRNRYTNYNLTPGQVFDIADTGGDIVRGWHGGSPLGPSFVTFVGLDLALSTASARPGEAAGKFAGAATAQLAGLAMWPIGGTVGLAAGRIVGAAIGGVLAGPLGAGVGATIGGLVGKWGTRFVVPFLIDPYLRRIGRPINRLVSIAQHRAHFGQGFQDSSRAWSMRQQSVQELRGSLLNAMQYIGREAQLMHQ